MFDDTEVANQNISFASLTQNPQRQQANHALTKTLLELELEGVSSLMVAELLLEYLIIEMEPDQPVEKEEAITWLSQLHRFRDILQSKIDEIQNLYEDVHC